MLSTCMCTKHADCPLHSSPFTILCYFWTSSKSFKRWLWPQNPHNMTQTILHKLLKLHTTFKTHILFCLKTWHISLEETYNSSHKHKYNVNNSQNTTKYIAAAGIQYSNYNSYTFRPYLAAIIRPYIHPTNTVLATTKFPCYHIAWIK